MCESNVYVRDDEGDRLVMEDAVLLESGQGKVKITDILGEEKELEGDVEEITFLEHRIVIRER
ncbi:MAG: CooT family nickel-binding protein [Actinobacteria bacterium]|nr:CooT family nickel-binding protein [Actinomycetota bacterium]